MILVDTHVVVWLAFGETKFSKKADKDPADRIIAAAALVEGLPLLTADRDIRKSGAVRTIW